ncbi:kinase domain protein [Oesophagostomum dentatum]|uniref:non-specific serine/threonine protein kinase n=1 Tax=Oesophagostomum dentatum TaxID=61180 RepID=A0A0B1TKS8_OESDE|nr:kinase domain protein [Oesophagostomum dentatum]
MKDRYVLLNGRTPEDDTAMFIACTNGQVGVVTRLLNPDNDHVLVNPINKDTVLHAAVSSQSVDVLQVILKAFPALVANSNCDGCSCLHWAAESGSTQIVKCLLEFDYPEKYVKEVDLLSYPPYRLAIDVNCGDNECRTALYRAVAKGHIEVLQYMLAFRCPFTDGVSRCPFQLDVYCSRGRTPLMVAAFNQSLPLLTLLLDAGADVNLPLAVLDSETCDEARCVGSGALVEATRSDAIHVVHFLYDRGALDTDNRALRLAAKNNNLKLMRVFLTRLVFPDPEYKVNKKNVDVGQIQVGQNLLPSSLCPSRAASLNWGSASLEAVQSDWFIAAALQVNPRLRTTRLSLAAITRVDLSCNRLTAFPSILFQMPSLRSLNLAENLITAIDMPGFYVTSTSLEILNLKQNRLEAIPPQFLSSLPQLTTFDISRNCLTQLPEFIWLCPSLKELNVASNHLSTLPMVGAMSRIGRVSRGAQPPTPTSPTGSDATVGTVPLICVLPVFRLSKKCARAPNSCVILVGTHTDQITSNPSRFPKGFLDEIETKVRTRFMVNDGDKHGLPRVLDLIFVNGKARSDVKSLLNAVYNAAWEVRIGKERALDQQIPSSYIAMLKIVRELHTELRRDTVAAVMTLEQFQERTKQRMSQRDDIEFRGACSFLNDSGEIVHFEDASLRQLIFVDPLWLADYLAAVVALRTPNKAAGIIYQDALNPLLKQFRSLDSSAPLRGALLDLLQKCELALPCLARRLIVPALLPDEYRLRADYHSASVKIAAKLTTWSIRTPPETVYGHQPLMRTAGIFQSFAHRPTEHLPLSPQKSVNGAATSEAMFSFNFSSEKQLRRVYAMSYIPAGFWSRLITRIIGDENVTRAIECLFFTKSRDDAFYIRGICDSQLKAEWIVWQTGLELTVKGHSVFLLKQFFPQAEVRNLDYTHLDFRTRDEQKRWRTFPLSQYALAELLFPALRYPAIGTRFVHSSEGDLLVNRFVPCSKCACDIVAEAQRARDDAEIEQRRTSKGLVLSPLSLIEKSVIEHAVRGSKTTGDISTLYVIHCFSIEECMLAGREYGWLECPSHGGIRMKDIAPDTVFVDIEASLVIGADQIRRGRLLGRGAFGFVFRATVKLQSGELCEVAQKMLEPVEPGPGARPSAVAAFKAAADKWRRDSLEFASRAYCTSRQELNLLSRLKHSNIVCLVGVCVAPLSLIFELAPLGALNQLLASHRKSGARLGLSVLRDAAVQVAKALEYLHSAHIIYRDLKSENVLVWRFPPPFGPQTDVLLKLGDYGISRTVMPSGGAKGFGGTEGFMAPEIVRFNGEEEYTQKVDCFSYGMFLYELITLKHPFEGEEHVKERLLEGARPVFLPHELLVPSPMLDLAVHCWAALPDNRPSSSQLVGYCSAPEFTHILDVCELEEALPPSSVLPYHTGDEMDDPDDFEAQLWLGGKNVTVMSCTQYGWLEQKVIETPFRTRFISRMRDTVWSCDECGAVTVYAASLHELFKLKLPSLSAPIIRAPELIGTDILLLVTERQLVLLRLNECNTASLLATLDSPFAIKTAATVIQTGSRQIWTGHTEGRISIHHLSQEDKFSFSSSLYLPDENVIVKDILSSRDGNNVWVTYEGGSRVFCWDVERRQICSSLDIRKVMPGSETIHTLDVELAEGNIVTCIALLEGSDGAQLYVGTSKGLLVVANALLLQPLCACRPYGGELTSLCVVEGPRDEDVSTKVRTTLSTTSSESGLGWVRERVSETLERIRGSPAPSPGQGTAVIVTIGRSYRSLSHRFVTPTPLNDTYSIAIWRTEEWV